jgi:hypothetical protein
VHGNSFEHKYLECTCTSTEHLIKITLDKYDEEWYDEKYGGIYIYVQLSQYRSLFKRILTAIKYVFKINEEKYGHWDCTLLDIDSVKNLQKMCNDALDLHELHQSKINNKEEIKNEQ